MKIMIAFMLFLTGVSWWAVVKTALILLVWQRREISFPVGEVFVYYDGLCLIELIRSTKQTCIVFFTPLLWLFSLFGWLLEEFHYIFIKFELKLGGNPSVRNGGLGRLSLHNAIKFFFRRDIPLWRRSAELRVDEGCFYLSRNMLH